MSVIKKLLPVLIVFIAIASMGALFECERDAPRALGQTRSEVKTSETVAAAKETVAESKVKGVIYETELFSILVPDGWVTKDLSTEGAIAVVITKGEDLMQLAVYISPYYTDKYPDTAAAEDYSKYLIENTVEQQNGTAIGEVKMFDVTFFKTSFTANGMDQTSFAGDKNGEVVNIIMGGKDHQNNAELKAMQESIKFK
jgi:hypothetical protein